MPITQVCPAGKGKPIKKNLGLIKLYREALIELAEAVGRGCDFSSEWTDSEGIRYRATSPSDIPALAKVLTPSIKVVRMRRSDPATGEKIMELILSPQAAILIRYRIEETADVAARISEICAEHKRTLTQFAGIHGLIVGTALSVLISLVAGLLLGPLGAQFWWAQISFAPPVALALGLGFKFLWKRIRVNLTQAVILNVPEKAAQGGLLSRKREDLVIAVIVLLLGTAINVSFGLLLQR